MFLSNSVDMMKNLPLAGQCSDGKIFQFCESILLLEVYFFRNFMCVQNKSKIKVSLKSNIQRIQKNPKHINSLSTLLSILLRKYMHTYFIFTYANFKPVHTLNIPATGQKKREGLELDPNVCFLKMNNFNPGKLKKFEIGFTSQSNFDILGLKIGCKNIINCVLTY